VSNVAQVAARFRTGVSMADFDAILRKALASRPGAPGEERRKIYERARQALVRQLTGFEPPLPPEDISRQRLALEAAIRKVEADVAANGGVLPGTSAPPLKRPQRRLRYACPIHGAPLRRAAATSCCPGFTATQRPAGALHQVLLRQRGCADPAGFACDARRSAPGAASRTGFTAACARRT
jgi:hypothetical protein